MTAPWLLLCGLLPARWLRDGIAAVETACEMWEHAEQEFEYESATWDDVGEAARCVNTKRPLTHLSDTSGRGLR